MKLAKTNEVPDGSLLVFTDSSGENEDNLVSYDFSSSYTSAGTSSTFRIDLVFNEVNGSYPIIDYVGIVGHNMSNTNVSISFYDENSVVYSNPSFQTGNEPRAITQEATGATGNQCKQIIIAITKNSPSDKITITHIAAGKLFDVPTGGYQSGYKIPWLGRNTKQRTAMGYAAGPTAMVYMKDANESNLRISNMPLAFAKTDWIEFIDFASRNAFFAIGEDDDLDTSFLGFDIKPTVPSAHNNTNQLVNVSMKHSSYIGILS